jgi:manganese/zinc/iron transport system permease protein
MVALLVIPACAARFWTEHMAVMTVVSALLGAASALVGAGASAVLPRLPSGAMIVVVASAIFGISMLAAPARGLVARAWRRRKLEAKIERQHLLRAIYERLEAAGAAPAADSACASAAVPVAELAPLRSWTPRQLEANLRRFERQGLLERDSPGRVRLSAEGARQAARCVHDHRLWELYLIHYADVAASQVDRGADAIEHVLDAAMVAELESLLRRQTAREAMPASPHAIAGPAPS